MEEINERSEVFVLLNQKSFSKKTNRQLYMDVTNRRKVIDFQSPFFAGDLKPYR